MAALASKGQLSLFFAPVGSTNLSYSPRDLLLALATDKLGVRGQELAQFEMLHILDQGLALLLLAVLLVVGCGRVVTSAIAVSLPCLLTVLCGDACAGRYLEMRFGGKAGFFSAVWELLNNPELSLYHSLIAKLPCGEVFTTCQDRQVRCCGLVLPGLWIWCSALCCGRSSSSAARSLTSPSLWCRTSGPRRVSAFTIAGPSDFPVRLRHPELTILFAG